MRRGAAVISLGVVDIGGEGLGKVQVLKRKRRGKRWEKKQEKDKHEERDNERSSTLHG